MAVAKSEGAALRLQALVKRYGSTVAVDGVSLSVPAGEFVTLLGPSGSGKTTTLNMIAGFVDLTSGAILMDGRPIDDVRPYRRNIGMVFQSYALFPHMTAAENIAFPLKQRRVARRRVRQEVEDALELVGLGGHGHRYPRELSGGQQQRVAVARATVFGPRVLLMDEPLGALDKKLRERLQLEIKRIHSELGITVVYVTHDQEEALVLSDRIAVFRDGRIEQVGAAEELYERPRSAFVADFLGESNIFEGRVEKDGNCVRIAAEGFQLRGPGTPDLVVPCRGALVVRPERVEIRKSGFRVGDRANVLSGVVREVVYLGLGRRLEIDLAGGRVAVVREQAGALSETATGDAVEISWDVEACTVLPAGAPSD